MSDLEQVAIFLTEARRRLGKVENLGEARMIKAVIAGLEKHFTGETPSEKEKDAFNFLFSGKSWREWEQWWSRYSDAETNSDGKFGWLEKVFDDARWIVTMGRPMKATPGQPFRHGEIAKGDRIALDWHGRRIEGKVYGASEVAVHFKWIATGPDNGRDGSCDYAQVCEIIEPAPL